MSILFTCLSIFAAPGDPCSKGQNFLGFPAWYKYLETTPANGCAPHLDGIGDIWLIGLALIEMLLRAATLIAIFFIVFAGVQYSNSGANTDKLRKAKNTLIDAIAGLVIALVATAVVSFIASRIAQ